MNNLGGKLYFKTGKALDIFSRIIVQLGSFTVFSHFETGNILSRKRDLDLRKYFDEQGIKWIQVSQDGVKRPNINRDGWSYHWNLKMNEGLFGVPNKVSFKKLNFILTLSSLGLTIMMFFAILVRIKINDNISRILPAMTYFMLNAVILYYSTQI